MHDVYKNQPTSADSTTSTRHERAGGENFRIHDLRHTFAATAVRGGASLFDVQKLPGQMSQRYAHLSDDGLKKATAGAATMLDEAA